MTQPNLTLEEIAERCEKFYQSNIKPHLTKADFGRFVVVDVNSMEYEIDDDDAQATRRLHERVPDAFSHGIRVGYSAAYFMGGYDEEPEL